MNILKKTLLLFTLLVANNVNAATLSLADQPLYLATTVAPNLTVILDDSGSMASGFVPDSISGLSNTKRVRSSYFNSITYNPEIKYLAPPKADGSLYATTFTNAYINGFDTTRGSLNLSTTYRLTWSYAPSATSMSVGSNPSADYPRLTSSNVPAYYYVRDNTLANCTATNINDEDCYKRVIVSATSGIGKTDERQNFANWFSFYRTRNLSVSSSTSLAFSKLSSNVRVAWESLNSCTSFNTSCKGWDNISTDSRISALTGTHKNDFFKWVSRLPASGGTPLRSALIRAGNYYSTSGINSPYAENPQVSLGTESSCRANYTLMMTDGIWNSDNPTIGNLDNTAKTLPDGVAYTPVSPYKDNNDSSLSDVAFKYWSTDLRTDLANNISPYISDASGTASQQYFNAQNDPANWQHMVTFTVGLGLTTWLPSVGLTWDGDSYSGSYDDLVSGNATWPATASDNAGNVADLWHAALDSRGEFFSSEKPTDIISAFNTVVTRVNQGIGASAAVAANTTNIKNGTRVYQARFNSADWSGELLAIPVNTDGSLPIDLETASVWKAKDVLNGQDFDTGRKIFTYKPSTNKGVAFRWPANSSAPTSSEIDLAQVNYLNTSPINLSKINLSNDGLGQSRLNWIRGDRSNEGTLRTRNYVLGDIIDSTPIVVTPPANISTDPSYNSFKTSYKNRQGVLYVGGNDGMLHGFNIDTGNEVLSYVPNSVFSNLNSLTGNNYSHKYYVNGSPSVSDVKYTNGTWHSVLVSGLGSGGKGIFSLDVTDPNSFSESNPTNVVKFEYNDLNDSDIGYNFGIAPIVKLNNNKWAAVFGNGYNSTGSGKATLFLVDVETGLLIKKITTSSGTTTNVNGLGNPSFIDVDGNGTVDYGYAGDLNGNLWKFDLSTSSTTTWSVAYSGNPLINVGQPITSQPDISPSKLGGYMVLFGTGKYLELNDKINSGNYAFYGIWDNGSTVLTTDLAQQTVTSTIVRSGYTYRKTSNNNVNYPTQKGWYFTLPITGERVVTNPIVSSGLVYFTTTLPTTNNCSAGGSSFLMELDYMTGGSPLTQSFDTNQDNKIDTSDTIVAGVAFNSISSSPTILNGLGNSGNQTSMVYINQSNGVINTSLTTGGTKTSRRVSWRELIKQ